MQISSNIVLKTGNIFTSTMNSLGHGVNIDGVMGSGIAKLIRDRYPKVFPPYKYACDNGFLKTGDCLPVEVEKDFWVLNLASQNRPGKNARMDWLIESVEKGINFVRMEQLNGLALPRIGAGVGGLKWSEVQPELIRLGELNYDVALEIWSLPDADK